jgi:hypothetical protein
MVVDAPGARYGPDGKVEKVQIHLSDSHYSAIEAARRWVPPLSSVVAAACRSVTAAMCTGLRPRQHQQRSTSPSSMAKPVRCVFVFTEFLFLGVKQLGEGFGVAAVLCTAHCAGTSSMQPCTVSMRAASPRFG